MGLPLVGLEAVIENLSGFSKGADTITKAYTQIDTGATKVEKSSSGLSGVFSSVGGGLLSFGKVAAGVALGGVTLLGGGLVALGTKSVLAAADVGEMQSLFNTAFGQDAPKAREEIDAFAAAVGRNKYELEGFAGGIKSLVTPMGVTGDKANEMSIGFSKLAVDLSSFYNVTESDALESLRSGLIGETEPLRKFGIVLNQAAIEQKAMNMGIFDGKGQMDAATKAAATYALIMEQTKLAQGDAARTSGSWVNQTRALKSVIDETVVSIGMELLPVVTPLLQQFTSMAKGVLPRLVGVFKSIISTVSELVSAFSSNFLQEAGNDFGLLGQIVYGIEDTLIEFLDPAQNVLDAIYDFDTAILMLAQKISGEFSASAIDLGAILKSVVGAAFNFLIDVVLPALTTAIMFVVDNWDTFKSAIKDVVKAIKSIAVPVFESIGSVITDKVIPVAKIIVKWFKDDFPKALKETEKKLKPLVEEIFPKLKKIWDELSEWAKRNWPLIQKTIELALKGIEKAAGALSKFWSSWGGDISKSTKDNFNLTFKIIETTMLNILDNITMVLQLINGDWEGAWETWNTMNRRQGDLVNSILKSVWDNMYRTAKDAWNNVSKAISETWTSIVNTVKDKANQVYSTVRDKFDQLPGLISGFASKMLDAAKRMMQGVIDGIIQRASDIYNSLSQTISNAINSLKSSITSGSLYASLVGIGTSILNAIKNGINSVADFASRLISKIQEGINSLSSSVSSGTIYNILTNVGRNIINYIASGINAVASLASTLISKVQSAINSLSASSIFNSLYGIGEDIVNGIIDGVESMGSELRGVLEDIVNDAIEAIKDQLGIGSPSKVFFAVGTDMMRGLQAGISALTPTINAQLQSAVAGPAVNAPALGATGTTNIYNSFQLGGNTINSGMDQATFEARVMRAIRRNL